MSLSNVVKVLVVGSGVTGCAAAAMMRQTLPASADITIWDKAQGAGGRMSTSRNTTGPAGGKCTVDLGAQYITLTTQYKDKRRELYSELIAQHILAPLTTEVLGANKFNLVGSQHFITPQGISSLVKHFLHKANANVEFDRHVVRVEKGESEDSLKVTDIHGKSESFQAVVITMPVPQILHLKGIVQKSFDENRPIYDKLCSVVYSSRYALGLFYPPGTELPYSWAAKYFDDNACVRFVAIDNQKRAVDATATGPSVVIHTHVQFGLQHVEQDKEIVKGTVMKKVKELLPDLPEPLEVKCQKWRYSQVYRGYPGQPGSITLKEKPLIILGGDAFTTSTFDACLDSAESLSSKVTDFFKNSHL